MGVIVTILAVVAWVAAFAFAFLGPIIVPAMVVFGIGVRNPETANAWAEWYDRHDPANGRQFYYWTKKAAKLGHPGAQWRMSILCLADSRRGRWELWLAKCANSDSPSSTLAAELLADAYRMGRLGLGADGDEAGRWLSIAADKGSEWAARELERMRAVAPRP